MVIALFITIRILQTRKNVVVEEIVPEILVNKRGRESNADEIFFFIGEDL